MGQAIWININPGLLQWAREEAGYQVDEIAGKLNVDPERYQSWEKTGADVPLGKLKTIAKQYKRQLAMFFMKDVPPKLKLPKDFRNLKLKQLDLSKEIRLTLRRAYRYQELAADLKSDVYWNFTYRWLKKIEPMRRAGGALNSELLNWLRTYLKIDLNTQMKFRSSRDAFNNWRKTVESELGIFVFQFPMPMEEIHGFCVIEKKPFIIVLNKNHTFNGKIFTLFHELAHIFKHQSGICHPDWEERKRSEEFECNTFAASFLVPDDHVFPLQDLEELDAFARQYNISKEVYLRRVLETGQISKNNFFSLLEEIKEEYREFLKSKPGEGGQGFAVSPSLTSKSQRGEMFYNMVLDAFNNNTIDHGTATDSLGLAVKHLINV
jgi:Zn-dependent peptidase ImmA (M78 family)/transcriptional regulator with XRE-family HTH domain